LLLSRDRGPGRQRGHQRAFRDHRFDRARPRRALDRGVFELQQLTRAVAALAGHRLELDDPIAGQECVRARLDARGARAVARALGERLQHVATRERRTAPRAPLRPFQPLGQLARADTALRTSSQGLIQCDAIEAVLGSPRAPLGPESVDGDVEVLAPPGFERRHLRRARRGLTARSHQLQDLRAPPREVLDHPTRNALEIGGAVLDGLPPQPEVL